MEQSIIREAAQKFIKSITGLDVEIPYDEYPVNGWLRPCHVEIDPAKCGAIAPIFTKIDLELSLGIFDFTVDGGRKGAKLSLKYIYKHPFGSNGHTVNYIGYDDCEKFEIN